MRSSLRRATVIMILLAVFLAPGFLQARTVAWERASVGRPAAEFGFFNLVWNLLTDMYERGVGVRSDSRTYNKNGGQMDPSGTPETTTTTTDSDNGGQMDPSGKP